MATDDERIAAAVSDPRAPGKSIAVMTDPALPSGTDRVAAVATRLRVARRHDRGQRAGRRALPAAAPDRPGCGLARTRPGGGDRDARDSDRRPRRVSRPERGQGRRVATTARRCISAVRRSRGPATAPRWQPREFGDALRHVGLYAYRVGALRRITSHAGRRATSDARSSSSCGPCRAACASRSPPARSPRGRESTPTRTCSARARAPPVEGDER